MIESTTKSRAREPRKQSKLCRQTSVFPAICQSLYRHRDRLSQRTALSMCMPVSDINPLPDIRSVCGTILPGDCASPRGETRELTLSSSCETCNVSSLHPLHLSSHQLLCRVGGDECAVHHHPSPDPHHAGGVGDAGELGCASIQQGNRVRHVSCCYTHQNMQE